MLNLHTNLEVRIREFARTARRDEGATAVEYGLMVALIAIVIIGAVFLLGGYLNDTFTNVGDSINAVNP